MSKTIKFFPGCTHLNVCCAPIYEELLIETKTSVTGSQCHRRINDVYLLLNQDRLDRQTQEELIKRIEQQTSPSMLAQLRNKYSDRELCARVKSRYIQSKAELQSYMQTLMYQSDFERSEFEYQMRLQKDEEEQKKREEEEKSKQSKTD